MVSLILVILAAILNAVMDVISSRYGISVFAKFTSLHNFIDPAKSSRNKWKNGDKSQGERFFGSSTFLVWTTDAWHLCKTLMLACFSLAIVLYTPIFNILLDALIYWIGFGAIFELFWSKLFLKKLS